MAFQAGKDVYGEKPLTYSLAEGQAMLKNLEKYNRIFQLGTQIHAGENYHRVMEIIQSGKLGKIHTVRLWKTGGSPGLDFHLTRLRLTPRLNFWLGRHRMKNILLSAAMELFVIFLITPEGICRFLCHIADIMFMSSHPKDYIALKAGVKGHGWYS